MSEEAKPLTDEAMRAEMANVFDAAQGDKLAGEFGKIYDANEKASEKEAAQAMPPRLGESINETMERAHDWSQLPKAEQDRQRNDAANDRDLKAEAERRGVTLEQLTALKANDAIKEQTKVAQKNFETLKEVTDWRSSFDQVKQYYPGMSPTAINAARNELETRFRNNPAATIPDMIKSIGRDPLQVIQEIQARLQNDPGQLALDQAMEKFFTAVPAARGRAVELGKEIQRAIDDGEMEDSADNSIDAILHKHWLRLNESPARGKRTRQNQQNRHQSMESGMRQVYDRMHAKG